MLFVVFLCQNSYSLFTRKFLVFLFIFIRFISCTAKETNIAGQNKGKNNKTLFILLVFWAYPYGLWETLYKVSYMK